MYSPANAGEADVVAVSVARTGPDRIRVEATLRHADTGWDHYADKWDVLAPDGGLLGTRVLLHPHVDEQPFTRGLSGIVVPPGVDRITVRAHDSVHGYGGATMTVALPDG